MLAASPASFHPSNAAIITGSTRRGRSFSARARLAIGHRTSLRAQPSSRRSPPRGRLTWWACHPTTTSEMSTVAPPLRFDTTLMDTLAERVVIADGAMGTMLQAADLVLDDFAGLEGCNEILNDTRPDVVTAIHRAYFEAGADAVETNTFGANLPNLAEYDIAERIRELALKGAPAGPRGGRRDVHAGPAALRARLGRPGHQAADTRPRVLRAAARRLHRVRPRAARRRRRRDRGRDLPGPAAGQGGRARGEAGDARRGPAHPDRSRR